MIYELMDLKSANLVGTFATEAEALAVVRGALARHGHSSVADLALGCSDGSDEGRLLAEGAALAARALAASTTQTERTA
jgi:hypothetical protein